MKDHWAFVTDARYVFDFCPTADVSQEHLTKETANLCANKTAEEPSVIMQTLQIRRINANLLRNVHCTDVIIDYDKRNGQ